MEVYRESVLYKVRNTVWIDGDSVPQNIYDNLMYHVLHKIPDLEDGVLYTPRKLYGEAEWRRLNATEKQRVAKCLHHIRKSDTFHYYFNYCHPHSKLF